MVGHDRVEGEIQEGVEVAEAVLGYGGRLGVEARAAAVHPLILASCWTSRRTVSAVSGIVARVQNEILVDELVRDQLCVIELAFSTTPDLLLVLLIVSAFLAHSQLESWLFVQKLVQTSAKHLDLLKKHISTTLQCLSLE